MSVCFVDLFRVYKMCTDENRTCTYPKDVISKINDKNQRLIMKLVTASETYKVNFCLVIGN